MKIICTIGPSSESESIITQLNTKGMSHARINLSHVDNADAKKMIDKLAELKISTILDTRGAEIRTGKLSSEPMYLSEKSFIEITSENIIGDKNRISLSNFAAAESLQVGDAIRIDDNRILLKIIKKSAGLVQAEVTKPGVLTSNRMVFIDGKENTLPAITLEDEAIIQYGMSKGITKIVLSFVKSKSDVISTRIKFPKAYIIGKIECAEAIKNLGEIILESDEIWIDRFDLGGAMGFDKVPILQKLIIKECKKNNKPVLVASHFLESMIVETKPTRAESNDIANTVLDGADGFILAGETAKGNHPIVVLETLQKIISAAKESDQALYDEEGTVMEKLKALGYIE